MKDFYEILGLDSTATLKEIKKAYKKLAMKYHPDRWENERADDQQQAEAEFKLIEEAYRVLKDPINRAHYDKTGEGDMPKSAEMASKKLIDLFAQHIKAALERELAKEQLMGSQWANVSFGSDAKNGMDNLLHTIRHDLKVEKKELDSAINNLEKGVGKLNKYKRKVRSKGETNLYLQVIEQQLISTQGALAGAGIQQIALETALASLDDYEYILDDAPAEFLIGGTVKSEGVA